MRHQNTIHEEVETRIDDAPIPPDEEPVTKAAPTLLEEIETDEEFEPKAPVDVHPRRGVPRWVWLAGGGLIGLIIVIMVASTLVSSGQEGVGMLAFLATDTQIVTPMQPVPTETEMPDLVNTNSVTLSQTLTKTETSTVIPTSTSTPQPGATMISPKDGMVLVYVPAGEFLMGSKRGDPDAGDDEFPQHTVYLDTYWMDQTEVTNQMYADFLNEMGNQGEGGFTWLDEGDENVEITQSGGEWVVERGKGEHPVIEVSWYGAAAYCEWAGRRLPTEAEWEKAARGTDGSTYSWGEGIDCRYANYVECGDTTIPVGSLHAGASPYGVLDMAGNVSEWVVDWYDPVYYRISPEENPLGPSSGIFKVARSMMRSEKAGYFGQRIGEFNWDLRSANRFMVYPIDSSEIGGFRCALAP
jgi:formylglycine-generating enzyme required for sulfatase activity